MLVAGSYDHLHLYEIKAIKPLWEGVCVCVFSGLRQCLMCFKDVRGFSMTNFTIGSSLLEGLVT